MQRFLVLLALCASTGLAAAEHNRRKDGAAVIAPDIKSDDQAAVEAASSARYEQLKDLARGSISFIGAPIQTAGFVLLKRALEEAPPAEMPDGRSKGHSEAKERKKARDAVKEGEEEATVSEDPISEHTPVQTNNPFNDSPTKMMKDFLHWLFVTFFMLTWVVLCAVCAHFYVTQPVTLPAETKECVPAEFQDWKFGLFECFSSPANCAMAFCCPGIRWAYSVKTMGFTGFWLAFTIFMGMDFLGGKTAESLAWLVLAAICTGFRQEMRQKLGFEKVGGFTICLDFLLYWWCSCCAITQEARQSDEAILVGHPAIVMPTTIKKEVDSVPEAATA